MCTHVWISTLQFSVSSTYGVPYKLETTYDVLQFPSYQLSAYASTFHLAVLKATAELATVRLLQALARFLSIQSDFEF